MKFSFMDPEYTKNYHELKSVFDPGIKEISIPGSEIRISILNFSSDFGKEWFLKRE